LLGLILCVVFILATQVSAQEEELLSKTNSGETNSTITGIGESKGVTIDEDDDDLEDYDQDDFAILGNEWLLKEIKEIEDQIKSESNLLSEEENALNSQVDATTVSA